MAGYFSRSAQISGNPNMPQSVGVRPTVTWPQGDWRSARISSTAASICCTNGRKRAKSFSPSGGSAPPRPLRYSSAVPHSCSSLRTCRPSAGWAMPITEAALEKLPYSATCIRCSTRLRSIGCSPCLAMPVADICYAQYAAERRRAKPRLRPQPRKPPMSCTSSHALLRCLADNGVDRVFVVPGESYLGVLDALSDFGDIDVVTCRHESGAAFMAAVDGRLTGRPGGAMVSGGAGGGFMVVVGGRLAGRPGVAMVSRGPGATNAAIGIHAAQQDAAPMILVIGQVPKKDLRKEAFQEIDYQQMFGALAKWVCQVTAPEDLAAAAFKAVRVALSGLPGPVVLVIPEDIQQQQVAVPQWVAVRSSPTQPDPATVRQICRLLQTARRPLIIAGSALDRAGGREALLDLATQLQIPVAVSFRGHDLFPNQHALFAGDLGLANPAAQ